MKKVNTTISLENNSMVDEDVKITNTYLIIKDKTFALDKIIAARVEEYCTPTYTPTVFSLSSLLTAVFMCFLGVWLADELHELAEIVAIIGILRVIYEVWLLVFPDLTEPSASTKYRLFLRMVKNNGIALNNNSEEIVLANSDEDYVQKIATMINSAVQNKSVEATA